MSNEKVKSTFRKRFIYYFAAYWSLIAGVYLFCVTFLPIANERAADTILGFLLGTIVATIINYFFSSTTGSKEKSKDLMNIFNSKKL